MNKGPKKGSGQTPEHIAKRIANRTKWNGGHNLMTTDSFLYKLRQGWSDCPYDLSKVDYIKNDVKVTLVCAIHGDFLKWPSDILNHSGCPMCSGMAYTESEIIAKLSAMFPKYDYTNSVFHKSTKPMQVRCKKHDAIFPQSHYRKEECPTCSTERRLQERIAAGRARDPNSLTEYEKYKKDVWKETGKSYKKYKNVLGERSRARHLDHVYSILHGFRDSIDPLILGNIVNLRIIDSKMNQSKSMNSDFTKAELMKLYEDKQ
jgi:hypothetical protein